MSKLADIFRPKSLEIASDGVVVPMPLPASRVNGGHHAMVGKAVGDDLKGRVPEREARLQGTPQATPHRSDESEALHRLLVNTRRKFDDLDDLKGALDEMVLPFRGAMRALEQERALSAHLSQQLNEKAAAHEELYDDLRREENKARGLEADTNALHDALDQARASGHAAENARTLLGEEIKRRDAAIAALERRLEHEALQREALAESCRVLQEQALAGEQRLVALHDAVAEAERRSEVLKEDKRSLWQAAEQAYQGAERLNRRLVAGEGALNTMRAELQKAEVRHAEACAERNRLADAVDEMRAQQQVDRRGFDGRIEALEARAAAAERQVAEMRQRLIERTEEARAFICKAAEATMARATAERQLAAVQLARGIRGRTDNDPTESRTALSEFLRALNLKSREMALASAAEKMALLSERKTSATAESQALRAEIDKRVGALVEAFRDEGPRRGDIEKTLDAARQAAARLERDVSDLSAELGAPASRGEPAHPAPVNGARRNDQLAARGGGLGYQAGLVAHLRPPAADDDPGRSIT